MRAKWRDGRLRTALRLYVLTDDGLLRGRSLGDVVRAAIAGGATAIQLRSKGRSARDMCAEGRVLRAICAAQGVLFVVNDRVDVALACEADGVHLGQEDLPCARVRAIAGPEFVIGVSAATPEEALTAAGEGADYLGTGAVFATRTKADAGDAIGIGGLGRVVAAVPLPVVGIGGIHPDNAARVVAAGAAGVAVISAVVGSDDVTAATARIATAVGDRGGSPSGADAS